MEIGTKIQAIGKSHHVGQKGTVVADYVTMLLVVADDQKYENAHTNSGYALKVFQVDSRFCKEIK